MVALGVLLLIAGGAAWYHREWAVYHGYAALTFSTESWGAADAETRGHMLDDLLASHPLKGKTAEEVIDLLGQPDEDGEFGLRYRVGYRGFKLRAPMVFSYTLFIDLDRNGFVERVFTDD